MYQALYLKWRPARFDEVVGQEHITGTLHNAVTAGRLGHAYLFSGPRGTGKTTTARLLAKAANCLHEDLDQRPCGQCAPCVAVSDGRFLDLIEIDAASNTGVDDIRDLREKINFSPSEGRFKVYIIDEVHMLSKSAFNAMLKTLEEPPEHVKFILATTDPQKIPVTVLSRCLQFNLKQLPPALIAGHLQYVLEQEQISFEKGAIAVIGRTAQGSMRDALSLMDQAIAFSAGKVEESAVRSMLGAIDQGYLFDLLTALREQDGVALLGIADNMAERSVAFDNALQELATLLHRIAVAQTVPNEIEDDDPERARHLEFAATFTAEEVQLFYQIAIHGRDEIDLAPDEYAGFTMALLRMLAFSPAKDIAHPPLKTPVTRSRPSEEPVVAGSRVELAQSPVSVQPAAAARPANVENSSGNQPDWGVMLDQLNVQGMAQQLAKHCVMESFSDRQITLRLSQEHKHLQTNRMAAEKLQAALTDYFAKPMKLNIVLGNAGSATPAILEQQSKQLKQQLASDSIVHDSFVHDAQTKLDAILIEESIKPIQQVKEG